MNPLEHLPEHKQKELAEIVRIINEVTVSEYQEKMDHATGQLGETALRLAIWFPGRMVLDLA